MKLIQLLENVPNENKLAIQLLQQGKACHVYTEEKYNNFILLTLSIWSDIPETITVEQLDKLLNMSEFDLLHIPAFVRSISVDIKSAINCKQEIIEQLNDPAIRTNVTIHTYKQWVSIIKDFYGYQDNNDFED